MTEKQAQVKVTKKSSFAPIWIVPIIALLIGAYLVYDNYENKGLTIQITFENGDGLEVDKTKIKYKGVEIGHLTGIDLMKNENNVTATAIIDKDESYLVVDGTEFWLVKPTVTAGKISGLSTIISGDYIKLRPGNGNKKTKFIALKGAPVGDDSLPGLHFTLISDNLGSLAPGSGIFYRQIKVGEINNHKLKDDNKLYVQAYIEPEYEHFITDNTRFWNVSGITIDAGLSGVKIHSESFSTILAGGVTFDNPPGEMGIPVKNGTEFQLYDDRTSAMQTGGLNIIFRVDKLGSLNKGAPILYNELRVGEIEGHKLTPNEKQIDINAYIYPDYAHLVKKNSRFWDVSGINISASLSGLKLKAESLQTIVDGGVAFSNRWGSGGKNAEPGTVFKVYESYDSAFKSGTLVMITFKESKGLSPGNALKYKGVEIGSIESVKLNEKMDKIKVNVRIIDGGEQFVRAGSKFWVAEPEIGLGGVKNAGSILSKYIEVIPGVGPETYEFTGLEQEPVTKNEDDNLNIVLLSDRLASVNAGAPVYYKQIEVGKVTGHKLSDNAQYVVISISINSDYASLVRENSKFWNVSGIGVDFYFFGIKAKTESISSLIKGGVAFATPEQEMGDVVGNGFLFKLYEKPDKKWLKWKPSINYKDSKTNTIPASNLTGSNNELSGSKINARWDYDE